MTPPEVWRVMLQRLGLRRARLRSIMPLATHLLPIQAYPFLWSLFRPTPTTYSAAHFHPAFLGGLSMLFRCVLQDSLADLWGPLDDTRHTNRGGGASLLNHLCRADTVWVLAARVGQAAYQVRTLARWSRADRHMLVRFDKCHWAELGR